MQINFVSHVFKHFVPYLYFYLYLGQDFYHYHYLYLHQLPMREMQVKIGVRTESMAKLFQFYMCFYGGYFIHIIHQCSPADFKTLSGRTHLEERNCIVQRLFFYRVMKLLFCTLRARVSCGKTLLFYGRRKLFFTVSQNSVSGRKIATSFLWWNAVILNCLKKRNNKSFLLRCWPSLLSLFFVFKSSTCIPVNARFIYYKSIAWQQLDNFVMLSFRQPFRQARQSLFVFSVYMADVIVIAKGSGGHTPPPRGLLFFLQTYRKKPNGQLRTSFSEIDIKGVRKNRYRESGIKAVIKRSNTSFISVIAVTI